MQHRDLKNNKGDGCRNRIIGGDGIRGFPRE